MEPPDQAKDFLKMLRLEEFYVPVDPERILKTFTGVLPQIFIYKEDTLVKHYEGEVNTEFVFKYINEISDIHKN
jgi:hypothetical protein